MASAKDPYLPLNRLKEAGNLPVIPQLLVQLIDLCHQPEIDLQAVGKLIKKDAALAVKVLQLCNSAFIGARSAFMNVEQAVIYLGADTVKNLAISVSVQQVFRRVETNGLLNMDRFWYHSYQNAILARRIAEAVAYPNPSEAYLAGLLHDLGKLLLWIAFPGKYVPLLLKGIRCHNGRLSFLEQKKLQISHCEAGAWLIEQWGLPSMIADAIRYHHHPVDEVEQALPLTRITYLADIISHSDNPEQECDEVAMQLFRLAPGRTEQLQEGIDEQIQEVAHELGIRIPSGSRSTLDPEEPASKKVHKEATRELVDRVRNITQLTGLLDNLLGATNREQTSLVVEQSLKILFNQTTCLLLLFNEEKNRLQGLTSNENPLCSDAPSLLFSLDRHRESLPVRALELQQMMHSFMPSPDKTTTMLDTQIIELLGTEGMIIFPMTVQRHQVGLLVIGVTKDEHLGLLGHAGPLQLLASQAAAGLAMQNRQEQERQRIAAERLEAAAMIARKIAHEINNPLAILRNYLKVLDKKLNKNTEIHEELAIIDQEFERIGKITHQLRDIASERPMTRLEKIDLNHLLAEMVELYQAGLPADDTIVIEFHPDPTISRLQTDANGLRQVITNLLNNSIEALNGRGTIMVSTELKTKPDHTEQVIITIVDDGPGVAENLQQSLFQAGTSGKGGGHGGLGLAITTKIVKQLGGSLFFKRENKNTTFGVIIPVIPT
ncbi:MAG TPA: HDOD domain-containing protein [Desulfobulbaceae bacterium]|nr:HDOD domain-containing protein [Desulfobulbaceae bacterium]